MVHRGRRLGRKDSARFPIHTWPPVPEPAQRESSGVLLEQSNSDPITADVDARPPKHLANFLGDQEDSSLEINASY